jgi:hypothetical protein
MFLCHLSGRTLTRGLNSIIIESKPLYLSVVKYSLGVCRTIVIRVKCKHVVLWFGDYTLAVELLKNSTTLGG